jgi:nucleoside-diphosphate-sugar epimerase
MTILVVGASGATGRLLVEELLGRGHDVRAIVRSPERFSELIKSQDRLTVTGAVLLEQSEKEMARHVDGCDAVVSCLGHNPSLKGIYGHPRRLVTDATMRLCNAIKSNKSGKLTRYVLMNTTANRNRDRNEPSSSSERGLIGLLRLLLPPQVDNEKAADYLRIQIGQKDRDIEWVAVRPDGLIDEEKVSEYHVHPSPTRSVIFNAGKTSRINVGHFMAELITNDQTWNMWKGQMPVIYNADLL